MKTATARAHRHIAQTMLPFSATGRHLRPTGEIRQVIFKPSPTPDFDETKTWAPLRPKALAIGSTAHPTPLLQPSLHRTLNPPLPHVPVLLDRGMLEQAILSSEQLEIIARSLSRHSEYTIDENGRRIHLAEAIVLGTGSGKTSIGLGIIEATRNLLKRRHPAIIVTSNSLIQSVFIEQAEELGIPQSDMKIVAHANLHELASISIHATPTLLFTYALLRRHLRAPVAQARAILAQHPNAPWVELLQEHTDSADNAKREYVTLPFVDLLLTLLGDDPLIIWDECDGLRNVGSDQYHAFKRIDNARPDARMVFISASATPNPEAIAYVANRLGIAGKTGMFSTAQAAVQAASSDLLLAEIIIANGVALGTISTGGLSYEGIVYDTVTTNTTNEQRVLLDSYHHLVDSILEYAKARIDRYQDKEFDRARFDIPTKTELTVLARLTERTLIMDLCRDALFNTIDASLAAGRQIIVELAHTGESQRKVAIENEEEQLGTSGKQLLQRLIAKATLPLKVRTITEGDERVLVDRKPELTARMKAIFARTAEVVVESDHVLTALCDRYGPLFDEITGRTVRTSRPNGVFTQVKRHPKKDNAAAIKAFNSGKIRVLAISESGARGIDLHAASHFPCRAQRELIPFDPFVSPASFVQALGRACRTAQVSWPRCTFFNTDLPALCASLAAVVNRVRTAGACIFGDRRSIRLHASTSDLFTDSGVKALSNTLLRASADPVLAPYVTKLRDDYTESRVKLGQVIRRVATFPTSDGYQIQQQFWDILTEALAENETAEKKTTLTTVVNATAQPTLLCDLPALALTMSEPDRFTITWTDLESRIKDADVVFSESAESAEGIACYTAVPMYYKDKTLFIKRTPSGTSGMTEEAPGAPIEREIARARWNEELERIPHRQWHGTLVPLPLNDLITLDTRLTEHFQAISRTHMHASPIFDRDYLKDHLRLIKCAGAGATLGLWITLKATEQLQERYDAYLAASAHRTNAGALELAS